MAHRELEAGFGLEEIRRQSEHAAILVLRRQAWAHGVLVLASHRAWGLGRGPIRPPGRWWNGLERWSSNTLWRGYRTEL